ncbi:hypothetical protein DVK05_03850 [Halorubrum sp. Atlit-8R]|uniref:hypothetical protein n=1 Tax=unclassified Halorubrum TaxID=2642239 RepID=UPI000EF21EC5|nr:MULTISPECIES: hypothetical protein [unclassified Halorubrum]RLM70913.1 hypothetical protein DVK08_01910 [Halorubrum sp. Atlit-9R]RLM71781.1 hypothetical protein DVK08_06650 [Halorubrum sp. Atlit-9R]RLM82934.1 hypothetical protein DVK05_03850 [Halorubrum sp. Atlit-8R]
MGLLVVATFVAVAEIGAKRVAPGRDETGGRYEAVVETLGDVARTPVVWAVSFVGITVLVGGSILLGVGSFGIPEGLAGTLVNVAFLAVGLLLVGFVFLGAYFATRSRGLGNAHGVAAGTLATGAAFLVLVTVQLVVGVVG